MAERIDERKVVVGSKGTISLTLPRVYIDDMGIKKGDRMDIFRDGNTLIISPKKGEEKRGAS